MMSRLELALHTGGRGTMGCDMRRRTTAAALVICMIALFDGWGTALAYNDNIHMLINKSAIDMSSALNGIELGAHLQRMLGWEDELVYCAINSYH